MTLGNALNSLANRRTGKAGDEVVKDLRDEIVRGAKLRRDGDTGALGERTDEVRDVADHAVEMDGSRLRRRVGRQPA